MLLLGSTFEGNHNKEEELVSKNEGTAGQHFSFSQLLYMFKMQ